MVNIFLIPLLFKERSTNQQDHCKKKCGTMTKSAGQLLQKNDLKNYPTVGDKSMGNTLCKTTV